MNILILSSCYQSDNDIVNIKIRILQTTWNEDIYDTGQTVAWEEIRCEILNSDQYKNITIINDDHEKMKTLKKDQIVGIGVRKSDLKSNDINMNEIIWM